DSADPPWRLRAALAPGEHGHRTVDIETQKLPARDVMLAMRVEGPYEPDLPLSGRIRADIGPDGIPQMLAGRLVADNGFLIAPDKQRIDVLQGDIGNMDVGVAISGNLDFSTPDPRLTLGVAANRMTVAALRKIWPFCVTPKVRDWVEEHMVGGTIERLAIAAN